MIKCNKCRGRVFVDLTFTDNKNYETFCLRCGRRWFIGPHSPLFWAVQNYVRSALAG